MMSRKRYLFGNFPRIKVQVQLICRYFRVSDQTSLVWWANVGVLPSFRGEIDSVSAHPVHDSMWIRSCRPASRLSSSINIPLGLWI